MMATCDGHCAAAALHRCRRRGQAQLRPVPCALISPAEQRTMQKMEGKIRDLEKACRRLKQMLAMPEEEVHLLLRAVTSPESEIIAPMGPGGGAGVPGGLATAEQLRALEQALLRARGELLGQGQQHGEALGHLESALVSGVADGHATMLLHWGPGGKSGQVCRAGCCARPSVTHQLWPRC